VAKSKYAIFKKDPFDSRLGAHKIHKLSSRYGTTVYGGHVEGDLCFTFLKDSPSSVLSLDIGTHDIYK
jgi:hypothetical protein